MYWWCGTRDISFLGNRRVTRADEGGLLYAAGAIHAIAEHSFPVHSRLLKKMPCLDVAKYFPLPYAVIYYVLAVQSPSHGRIQSVLRNANGVMKGL